MNKLENNTKPNLVELYKKTALKELRGAIYEARPLLPNGIKVTQKGDDDSYLLIYQDLTFDSVILDVYDDYDRLVVRERAIFNSETLQWMPQPFQ